MEVNIPHGYKTYIVAIGAVAYALGGMVSGYVSVNEGVFVILSALGLSGLRDAIARFLKDYTPQNPPPTE